MMMVAENENHWNVKSLYEFQFFNCPICPFKNYLKQDFVNHAVDAHPKSKYYFIKISNHNSFDDVQIPLDNNIAEKLKDEEIEIFRQEVTGQTIDVKSELDDYRESLEGKPITDCHEQLNLIDDPLGTYELSNVKTEEIYLNENGDLNYCNAEPEDTEKLPNKTKPKSVRKKLKSNIKIMVKPNIQAEYMSYIPEEYNAFEQDSEANEFSTLRRLDIVNYLEKDKKLKPTAGTDEYSNEYVAFVCEKLGIVRSDVHYEVFIDISKIKSFYRDASYNFDFMIKKHKKFFNAFVKLKKHPPNPTSYATTSASSDNNISEEKNCPMSPEIFEYDAFEQDSEANEFSTLRRLDIVNYLEKDKKLKPTAGTDEYSNEYVAFVCEKLGIVRSDVHYEVFIDISKIKSFYRDASYNFDFMIKKHKKFFNAFVKLKKHPPNPTSYATTSASSDNKISEEKSSATPPVIFRDRKHICDACGKSYSASGKLKEHKKAIHDGIKDFMCTTCGKSFSRSGSLRGHIRGVHLSDRVKKHICDACGKSYPAPGELKQHKNAVHDGIKDFMCTTCGKSYSYDISLRKHIRSRHEIKSCVCESCGKAFSLPQLLKTHIKMVRCIYF